MSFLRQNRFKKALVGEDSFICAGLQEKVDFEIADLLDRFSDVLLYQSVELTTERLVAHV